MTCNNRLQVQLQAQKAVKEALEKDLAVKRKRNIELTVENERLKTQRLEDELARDGDGRGSSTGS